MQRGALTGNQMKESGLQHIKISSDELAMPYMKHIKELIGRRYNLKKSDNTTSEIITSEIIKITEIIPIVKRIEAEHENRYLIKYNIEHISKNYPDNWWLPVSDDTEKKIELEVIEYYNPEDQHHRLRTIHNLGVTLFPVKKIVKSSNGGKKLKSNRTKKPKRKGRRTRSKMSKRAHFVETLTTRNT